MSTDGEGELNALWTKSQEKESDNKEWAVSELGSTWKGTKQYIYSSLAKGLGSTLREPI